MSHVDLVPRELDLSAYGHVGIVDKFNVVPGLRTSTAFFTFLRANLVVDPATMSTPTFDTVPSNLVTVDHTSPSSLASRATSQDLHHVATRPSSPSRKNKNAAAAASSIPDSLPPLTIAPLTDRADRREALRLVADSIAQQRQTASSYLIFHPYLLPVAAAALAVAYQYGWRLRRDPGTTMLCCCAVLMTYFMIIRYYTSSYISLAESLDWSFLQPFPSSVASSSSPSPERTGSKNKKNGGNRRRAASNAQPPEDTIIGARFGDELIGAVVLRLEPNPSSSGGSNSSRSSPALLRGGKGVIRAWTVKLRYRGRGVGGDLLQEAVRYARERCGRDAAVGFAAEHANSARVPGLPESLNMHVSKGEQRAARSLDGVLKERAAASGSGRSRKPSLGGRRR